MLPRPLASPPAIGLLRLRNFLADDHRDSKNHQLLIQAWKEYVAKHFPQPSADSAAVVADSDLFDFITEPILNRG